MRFCSYAFALLFALLLNPALVSPTCYNPDGTAKTSPAYQPCVQTVGTVSQCCGTNWTATDPRIANDQCEPSGLCLNNNPDDNQPLYWRGSCTDKTWKSPNCLANLCTNSSNGGDASDNVALTQCLDGSWCCGQDFNSTCCNNNLGIRIDAIIGVSNATSSTSSSSSSSSSSTSSPTSSSPVLLSLTTSIATSPTSSVDAQSHSSSLSTGAKAGIGIGVGVLVLSVVAVAAFIIFRGRQRTKVAPIESSNGERSEVYEMPHEGLTQEIGTNRPEAFQHEVEGHVPTPMAELSDARYR